MIDTTYYVWLFVFGIIAYICIVDENVPKFLYLMVQLLRINIVRFFWGIRLKWGLRWSTYRMKKDMEKFIKEYNKEEG